MSHTGSNSSSDSVPLPLWWEARCFTCGEEILVLTVLHCFPSDLILVTAYGHTGAEEPHLLFKLPKRASKVLFQRPLTGSDSI